MLRFKNQQSYYRKISWSRVLLLEEQDKVLRFLRQNKKIIFHSEDKNQIDVLLKKNLGPQKSQMRN